MLTGGVLTGAAQIVVALEPVRARSVVAVCEICSEDCFGVRQTFAVTNPHMRVDWNTPFLFGCPGCEALSLDSQLSSHPVPS